MGNVSIWSVAARNLTRRRSRTLILLVMVAVVTGTLLGGTILITGMRHALEIGTNRLGADLLVVPEKNEVQARSALLSGEPALFYMDRSVFEVVKKVDGVKNASPQLFLKPSSFTCCYNVEAFLVAFDPETDFTVTPWLDKRLRKPLGDDEVITGSDLPVLVGDVLPFFGTPFTVAGTMEPTGMKFFDQSVFMTTKTAYDMAANSRTRSMQPLELEKDRISAVLVRVHEGFRPEHVAIRIEHDLQGVKAVVSNEVISGVARQMGGLFKGIIAVAGVLWFLALLMLGFAFSMIVNERQRELGLLRTLGARRRHVFGLIIAEALFLCFAGGLAGIAIGSGLLYYLKDTIVTGLRLPYLLPTVGILLGLAAGAVLLAAATGLISSLLPAALASRMEPYEAIRRGE